MGFTHKFFENLRKSNFIHLRKIWMIYYIQNTENFLYKIFVIEYLVVIEFLWIKKIYAIEYCLTQKVVIFISLNYLSLNYYLKKFNFFKFFFKNIRITNQSYLYNTNGIIFIFLFFYFINYYLTLIILAT